MAEIEGARRTGTPAKLDEYPADVRQGVPLHRQTPLMEEASANHARLRGAVAFGRAVMEGHEFRPRPDSARTFAMRGLVQAAASQRDPAEAGAAAIHTLRDLFGPDWMHHALDQMRWQSQSWLGRSQQQSRPREEAEAERSWQSWIRTRGGSARLRFRPAVCFHSEVR